VLFVSHNMGTIKGLCTRGVLIKNGRIEGDGDVLSIINQYLKGINPLDGVFEIGKYDLNEKIIINYVVFKNQNGEIKQSFHIGDSLTVELHCVAVERIENPLFWIGVESEYGSLFGANSLIDGCSPDYVEGKFVISCTFKSLPLLPQSFTVWAGARDKSGMNFLTKSKEIGYFNIITKLSDVGFNSVLSDTIAANSSPLMLPYQWNFGSGKKYNVNIENYIRC
ncbi:MAG: Wzt carbohydrate-binding domain-containing protein, partial [Bacteroidia bacterium]|nr:Wzt carbohydrate-binding domain-containing protein [Bacteroidia bacterium]